MTTINNLNHHHHHHHLQRGRNDQWSAWRCSTTDDANCLPQYAQWYGFSPVGRRMWICGLLDVVCNWICFRSAAQSEWIFKCTLKHLRGAKFFLAVNKSYIRANFQMTACDCVDDAIRRYLYGFSRWTVAFNKVSEHQLWDKSRSLQHAQSYGLTASFEQTESLRAQPGLLNVC